MNNKEALFFIARTLTIAKDKGNRNWVVKMLKSGNISWDQIVVQGSTHYVLPAIYCNLKKCDLLHFLPLKLMNLMIDLTELNRVRNQQIVSQAKEINALLLKNNITPIFIKGTGLILQKLYDDIAERMIGDIDLIVQKKDGIKAYKLLLNNGYSSYNKLEKVTLSEFRHLPRLLNENRSAAVEIHSEVIRKECRKEFNYDIISKDLIQSSNNFKFLSYNNQLALCIIADQINDSDSIYLKKISLRNSYDLFTLSSKTDTSNAISIFKKIFHPLNNYLAIASFVMNTKSIKHKNTRSAAKSIRYFDENIFTTNEHNFKRKINLIKLSFIDSYLRKKLITRILRKNWRTQKLKEFGLLKN